MEPHGAPVIGCPHSWLWALLLVLLNGPWRVAASSGCREAQKESLSFQQGQALSRDQMNKPQHPSLTALPTASTALVSLPSVADSPPACSRLRPGTLVPQNTSLFHPKSGS